MFVNRVTINSSMKQVKEAPINMPKTNDDMSYVRGMYRADKAGAKYQQRLPSIDLGEIPGLNISHELMKDENSKNRNKNLITMKIPKNSKTD